MKWSDMKDERDAEGNPTPLAKALVALDQEGCQCWSINVDSTCHVCLAEAALKHLWHQLNHERAG